MYEEIGEFVKITCDKCERSEMAESEMAGKSFFYLDGLLKIMQKNTNIYALSVKVRSKKMLMFS